MNHEITSNIKRDYIVKLLEDGQRSDGRGFEELRSIEITRGIIKTAEGSAQVKLGDTRVIVGVKVGAGEPYPDNPDKGTLTVNAELVPMASPTFESGPPSPDAIELARVVDRGIRESGTINFDKLCIVEGEKVWALFIDIHIIDYHGNLFDASSLGVLAALDNTIVPGTRHDAGPDIPLNIEHQPVAVTMVKIGEHILVDPSLDEEIVAEGRITITTDENGDIRAIQKGKGSGFTPEEIKQVVETSIKVGTQVREKVFSLGDVVR